jgi:hypothetical protein
MSEKAINNGGHPHTAPLSEAAARASREHPQLDTSGAGLSPFALRPEFFRLPSVRGDPHFGFTRSFYYEEENRGYWKLARIRERGKLRGITLVPYDSVAAFVRSQMKAVDA